MPLKGRIRLAHVFVALLAVYALLEWVIGARGLATLVAIVLIVIGSILFVRFSLRGIRRSIWRLRNRLYVTYVFIGVVPIVLILALTGIGTYILTGQIGVYVVSSDLERRAASLADPLRVILAAKPSDRPLVAQTIGQVLNARIPGVQIVVSGPQPIRYPSTSDLDLPPAAWNSYNGYILHGGRYYSAAIVRSQAGVAVALAPIDATLLKDAASNVGAFRIGNRGGFSGLVPAPAAGFENLDFRADWFSTVAVAEWNKPRSFAQDQLWVTTRPSAVLGAVFSQGIDTAQTWSTVFLAVLVLLLVGELISLVIGMSLTRTITQAVNALYEGTLRIGKGDFAWRIPVKGHDQLAELGNSFNNMTEQIEKLVAIAKEKERLQSEVEIAGEVQNQLFPRSAPIMRTIELLGVCQPARMVSGDYYDYLAMPDGNLALALGDVAGKGISAALLMASIQSIIRTQLAEGLSRAATAGGSPVPGYYSASAMVAQLNRQLYASTSPEKYATFFFGIYDDRSRVLTYTNAGHLQPLLLRNGESRLLEVTGTVVGAFPMIRYEEQTIALEAGDLLIAYTDGITEPENAYGEEFGMERLAETALRHQNSEPREIIAKIMEAVAQWSAAPELPDDMTVMIARGTA